MLIHLDTTNGEITADDLDANLKSRRHRFSLPIKPCTTTCFSKMRRNQYLAAGLAVLCMVVFWESNRYVLLVKIWPATATTQKLSVGCHNGFELFPQRTLANVTPGNQIEMLSIQFRKYTV